MHHFKAFDMINLQYEIKVWKKILNKATNDKNQHPPPLFSTLRLFLILFVCGYFWTILVIYEHLWTLKHLNPYKNIHLAIRNIPYKNSKTCYVLENSTSCEILKVTSDLAKKFARKMFDKCYMPLRTKTSLRQFI